MTRACILGCAGQVLTPEEIAFYREAQPWGFILFKRNIDNPDQTRALIDQMREQPAELRACLEELGFRAPRGDAQLLGDF